MLSLGKNPLWDLLVMVVDDMVCTSGVHIVHTDSLTYLTQSILDKLLEIDP